MEQSQKNKRKQARAKQITVIVLLALIVFFGILNLIFGDRSVKKPKFSAAALLSGQYTEEYEEYLSGRFVGEDLFRSAAGSLQAMFGRSEFNGIYRGDDHYLAKAVSEPNEKEIKKSVEGIGALGSGSFNTSVYLMLIPDVPNIYADKFPDSVTAQNQAGQFEQIRKLLDPAVTWVDAQKALSAHRNEDIYYHTDERWTSLGAKYGYEALADAMNLDTSLAPKMRAYAVNNDYSGPLARESGYEQNYEETVSIYSAENVGDNVSVLVENMDTGEKAATLYDSSMLEKDDKYDLFLGGECGMLDIKTDADTTDRLLIVRDSFANCLVPFLTPYFREIVMVDPDHYEGSLAEVMQETKFTSILFLYGGNSFVTDKSLSGLLGASAEPVQTPVGETVGDTDGADTAGSSGDESDTDSVDDTGDADSAEDTDSSGDEGSVEEEDEIGSSDSESTGEEDETGSSDGESAGEDSTEDTDSSAEEDSGGDSVE